MGNLELIEAIDSIKRLQFSFPPVVKKPRTEEKVFLDKFTFSCVQSTSFPWQALLLVCTQSTSFPWQALLLVCTVNKFPLTSFVARVYSQQVSLDKLCCSIEVFLVHLSSFPYRPYTHEQILLLQKLAWLTLEQDSLARKHFCQFFCRKHEQIKLVKENLLVCRKLDTEPKRDAVSSQLYHSARLILIGRSLHTKTQWAQPPWPFTNEHKLRHNTMTSV